MYDFSKLEKVWSKEGFVFYKYHPTVFKPFWKNLEPLTLLKRVRFFVDAIYGYSVYYMAIDKEIIGYCTITSGKNKRYFFARKNDILIGPYFVKEEHRGHGYAKLMVRSVITDIHKNWQNGYLYIKRSNASSIAVAKSIGAEFLFYSRNTKTRKLVKDDRGEFGIYMLTNPRKV